MMLSASTHGAVLLGSGCHLDRPKQSPGLHNADERGCTGVLVIAALYAGVFTQGTADQCVLTGLSQIMTTPPPDPLTFSPLYASTGTGSRQ